MRLGIPSRDHLYAILTPRQLTEWERLYRDHPWTPDSVEQGIGLAGSVEVNMNAAKGSPTARPNHFRDVPRQPPPDKHEAMSVSDLVARMGG